jgi:hypothetical protein
MSQFNTPTYDIERPTGQCAFTARALEPDETYIATLIEVEREDGTLGLKRIDVSNEAWEQGGRPDGLFCFWKATVPVPEEKKKLLVDDDVLMNLFRRLEDADQDDRIAFRFVLALILMRKKLLRYESSEKRDNGEWWQLTAKAPAEGAEREQLSVLDPHLDEQRIMKVTEQLGEILEAEL